MIITNRASNFYNINMRGVTIINKFANTVIFILKIIISLAISVWGILLIDHYEINVWQSIVEQFDGIQQIVSMITATDTFLKILEKNWIFVSMVNWDERMYMYLMLSLTMQSYILEPYQRIINFRLSGCSNFMIHVLEILYFITNFFLIFISNHILIKLFDKIAKIDFKKYQIT